MAESPHHPPSRHEDAFDCPHCGAYAQQHWGKAEKPHRWNPLRGEDYLLAFCERCSHASVWLEDRMLYPEASGPPPNPDLPEDIRRDYLEAQGIAGRSPRGAAALLRLCIQKLCKYLGQDGKKINDDIANLVKRGLPPRVQQALDVVRVVGNDAVHPGELDLRDDRETAASLFALVNLVAEVMISDPEGSSESI